MEKIYNYILFVFICIYTITVLMVGNKQRAITEVEEKPVIGNPMQVTTVYATTENIKVAKVTKEMQLEGVRKYVLQGYKGSRIDESYYNLLVEHCDIETLKTVIAISVAETGMGSATPSRQSNFWGYFKGGDRSYDPDRETMAKVICRGIKSAYSDIGTNMAKVNRYTNNNHAYTWIRNFNVAMSAMSK
jgi:hypothetical protein